jgi:CTD small phosphatase-like protein 2
MFIKDLRIFNRSLSSIVLVDNASYSFCFQIDNGIPIIPYYSGGRDYELYALEKYIQSLANVKDVREVNRETFRLDRYISYDCPERLVEELYITTK